MLAILSTQIANEFAKITGIETLPLEEYSRLDAPVSSHADMLICKIENTVFCYKDYYLDNKSLFEKIENNYKVVTVSKKCFKDYPNDIGLNVLVIGKSIFSRLDSTAKEILDYAKEKGYKLVNVNQGYSACSTLVINDKSAITSDISIYKALINEGFRALLVSSNDILLKGYNCGFIGGAGGVYNNTAYFFGDISLHCDYSRILSFLEENNCQIKSILSGGVYDFGGIKFL